MERLSDLLAAIGHFHPLLVHLPIGLLLAALATEVWSVLRRRADLRAPAGLLLALGALAAVAAAATGLLLARSGGYDDTVLERHEVLGLATAALAVCSFALHRWARTHGRRIRVLRLTAALCCGVMLAAAHYGGVLTHGSETPFAMLAAALRGEHAGARGGEPDTAAARPPANAEQLFTRTVAPILREKCQRCHGAEKQKSGLRLDSRSAALAGGKSGLPAIVPGDAMASNLVRAITLPTGNKRAMPPSGKPRLSADEVLALITWINRGAPWPDRARATGVAAADTATVEALRAAGFQLSVLAAGEPLIKVDVVPPAADLSQLKPLAQQIAWLDLSGFELAPQDVEIIAALPHLERLQLQHSNVTDAELARLADLPDLTYLNLYGTDVGDAAIEALSSLRRLRQLYLWGTRISPEGLERLRGALPDAHIDSGDAAPAAKAAEDARPAS